MNAAATRIVPLEKSGIPAVISLARSIWYAHYPGIITPEQIEYMLAAQYTVENIQFELSRGLIRWIQIYSDSELVGFASYGPITARQLKLHKLYIDPGLHGQGLGRAALEYVVKAAEELGLPEVCLNVNKQNEKAIRAYKRMGFSVAEELVVDIGSGFVMDDYVMVKKILSP